MKSFPRWMRYAWTCTPPISGIIKVNIGGTRGIFYDVEGMILLQFGKAIQICSVVHSKLLVVRYGLLVAMASTWEAMLLLCLNQIPVMLWHSC